MNRLFGKMDRLFAVVIGLVGIGTVEFANAQDAKIPALHATALSGDPVVLPAALQGKTGVLVIGFTQASRDEVTNWGKRLAAEYRNDPSVLYYEMPVLASVPKLLRGFVTDRMKSDVPPRARSRFVPIDADEKSWKQTAHFRQPDNAYILVVDSNGTVLLREEGAPTDASYAVIHDGIEAIRHAAENH